MQSTIIENFEAKLTTIKEPERKARAIVEFFFMNLGLQNVKLIEPWLNQMVEDSKKLSSKEQKQTEGWVYFLRSFTALYSLNDKEADLLIREALSLFEEVNDRIGTSETLRNKGSLLWNRGKFQEALEITYQALQISIEGGNRFGEGMCYYLLGGYYFDLKDYNSAEKYFTLCYDFFINDQLNDIRIPRSMIGMGNIALVKNQYQEALDYFLKALGIQEKIGDANGISRSLNDIANVYKKINNYPLALQYYQQSIAIRRKLDNKQAIITTLTEIGELYIMQNYYQDAEEVLQEAQQVAQQVNANAKLFRIYKLLSEVHKGKQNFEQALLFFEKFVELKDKIIGDEANSHIRRIETQAAIEKEQKEAEIFRLKNVELKAAYEKIEQKNKDIVSSMNYARRIQEAILPEPELFKQCFQDAFVLFRPKDIVSGDFYFLTEASYENPSLNYELSSKIIVAAVDCTGHGVPGAFMSMIGNDLLNEIVNEKEIVEADLILNQLHLSVRKALKQNDSQNRDGMDLALCVIDKQTQTLQFAGAANSLYYIEGGEFKEIKGDKLHIGGEIRGERKLFNKHTIQLKKPSYFYIASDGYQDQFGEHSNKKFSSKRLKELLSEIYTLPMERQKQILNDTMNEWLGKNKQIDDILVIGFAIA